MKKLLLIAMIFCCGIAFGQTTIAFQDFESGSDDWSYTASPDPTSITVSGDEWDVVTSLGTLTEMPSSGTNFFGGVDIANAENVNSTFGTLTFSSIAVTGFTNVSVSFDYEVDGFDSGDDIDYEVTIDGVGQGSVKLVDGFSNLNANGTETIAIPDGSTSVSIVVTITQNGTDYVGVDNFKVTGLAAGSQSVGFDNETSDETETNSSFTTNIPVTLSNYAGSQVDLSVTVSGGTADMSDYTLNTTSLSFTSSTSQNISIDINPDADIANETIEITLAETTSTGITVSPSLHTINVSDDDIPNIFITEIVYNTASTDDEWIEIYNGEGSDIDVSGWTIEVGGTLEFTFPGSTTLTNGSYTTIALGSNGDGSFNNDNTFTPDFAHADISADVANTNATNVLSNSSQTVSIVTDGGSTVNEVTYDDGDDSRTDGTGPSYEIIDLNADNSTTASNWQASAVDGGSPGAFSSVTVWDGSTDSDWSDASNWSDGVPDNTTNAIIANSGTAPVIAAGIEGACNDLTVNVSASLTVSSGGSLAIFDRAINNGTYTVEKAVTGSAGYSILGSPISGATIGDMSLADYVSAYDNTGDTWSTPSGTDAMSPGVGFFVGHDETSPTVSFSGTPNDGTVTYTVTETSGFELVANPYSAAITVADFLTDNTIVTGGAYLWDDGGANIGGDRVGDYIAVTGVGAASAVDPAGQNNGFTGDDSPADDGYIASVQGFFVEINNSGTLTFSADHQTSADGSNDESDHYRAVEFQKVKLAMAGNSLYNEVLVGLGEGATFGVDRTLDAKKFVSGSPLSFYSLMEDEKYVIQALPNVDLETISVPLGFDSKAGTFTMSIVDLKNIPDDVNVTLIDHLNNQTFDLKAIESFTFTTEEVVNDQRFELQFSPMEILSIESPSEGLSIFGSTTELTIVSSISDVQQVVIYSLDGKVAFNQNVDFSQKNVTLNTNLLRNQAYVLKIGEESMKFIIE